ncbi:MAG: glycosyltransferase [Chitinophagaceae bacterium]|nr:glycosyltransferase [Chitinophagaceae bacterium]
MKRKKVLWLCSWYPGKTEPFNGDFIQRHAQAAALYNDIHVIHVTADSSGVIKETIAEIKKEEGLVEHIVYYKKSMTAWGRFIGHYKLLFLYKDAIRKYIGENGKPDLVHVHVPVKAGLLGLWMKKKYNIPYLVTEHWGIYNNVADLNYSGRTNWFKQYTKKIFGHAARFISVSRFLAEGVNRLVIKKDYEVIPNVVNTDLFFYKERPAQALFRFIHVSNMVPLKNAEGIVRAFKLLQEKNNNAELVMVGDTNDFIRQYAAEEGLPAGKVLFKGETPYKEVAGEMQQANCFILFSNIENSPCVIGEALCCGLPVIATNVGGVPELVNESNSILIEAKDENALVNAMQQVMNDYMKYDRKEIAENARTTFSYSVIGKKFDGIYSGLSF